MVSKNLTKNGRVKINFTYFIAIFLIFLASSLYMTNEYRIFFPVFLTVSISIVILGYISHINTNLHFYNNVIIIYYLYILFSILSSQINADYVLLFGTIFMFITFSLSFLIIPRLDDYIIEKSYISFLILHLLIIVFSIVTEGLKPVSYSGLYYNPNSFGTSMASVLSLLIARFSYYLEGFIREKKFNKKIYINFLLIIIFSIFTIISSSRNAFLSILVLFIFSFMIIMGGSFSKKINLKIFRRKIILLLLISLILFIIFSLDFVKEFIDINIIQKFQSKSGDILDRRSLIWVTTMKEMKLFGHGRNYFEQFGLGAHNTFISILGQYGILPTISFIFFIIKLFKLAIIYSKINKTKNRYVPFFVILSFLTMSIAESMMLTPLMFLLFLIFGEVKEFLYNLKRNEHKFENTNSF